MNNLTIDLDSNDAQIQRELPQQLAQSEHDLVHTRVRLQEIASEKWRVEPAEALEHLFELRPDLHMKYTIEISFTEQRHQVRNKLRPKYLAAVLAEAGL